MIREQLHEHYGKSSAEIFRILQTAFWRFYDKRAAKLLWKYLIGEQSVVMYENVLAACQEERNLCEALRISRESVTFAFVMSPIRSMIQGTGTMERSAQRNEANLAASNKLQERIKKMYLDQEWSCLWFFDPLNINYRKNTVYAYYEWSEYFLVMDRRLD